MSESWILAEVAAVFFTPLTAIVLRAVRQVLARYERENID